ncbi:MAG: dephospho-CoA kinase [Rickettsiaceae bacterium]|nr:dephospho-CoA kinase [Rickettsiaceae bacterium]
MTRLVGITGNIASGKSWILDYLSRKGYRTLSSDDFVKNLYNDDLVQMNVLRLFPELGGFDKKKIADIIYDQQDRRENLEKLVYPYLIEEIKNLAKDTQSEEIIFVEIPLLFEKKFEELFDFIILVFCGIDVRLKRANGRGISSDLFHKISFLQTPDIHKVHLSDFIIYTDDDDLVEAQIDKILEVLKDK